MRNCSISLFLLLVLITFYKKDGCRITNVVVVVVVVVVRDITYYQLLS